MGYYAEVENSIVKRVISAPSAEWCSENLGGEWVQTSYNTRGGIHYDQNNNPDDGYALHKNYAGVGFNFDGVGFYAPQPFSSWTLNSETYFWEAPVPRPETIQGSGKDWIWNEETLSWQEVDLI